MSLIRAVLMIAALALLSACSSKFKTYDGPEVTRIVIFKENRQMFLLHQDQVLRGFNIALGFEPEGHKTIEGDGRTPEGNYIIDRRNPNSDFHLSLGISYPNARDVEVARRLGESPGGNIFIHGTPRPFASSEENDWTWGCIAVTNDEMEDVYAMVKNGTPITILP